MTSTPWSRFVMPYQYSQTLTGAPQAGARLYFYSSGTTTALDTYADAALTIPNTNPVEADQYGVFPDIFLQSTSYRVVLTEAPTATGGPGAELWSADPVSPYVPTASTVTNFVVAECTIGDGSTVPTAGMAGIAYIPVACTLTSVVVQALTSSSISVDIWAAPFVSGTNPTISNSIVASAPPVLSTSVSSIDTTLTGWTKSITAGSAMIFYVNSASTGTYYKVTLNASIP